MNGRQRFASYTEFRREVLARRAALADAVEEMADELYQRQVSDEFDALWDSPDDEA